MPTYTFHHYEGEAPTGITFGEFAHDRAALVEAERLLEWHEPDAGSRDVRWEDG